MIVYHHFVAISELNHACCALLRIHSTSSPRVSCSPVVEYLAEQKWHNTYMLQGFHLKTVWAGAIVQWLKLPAWKVGDRGFEPRSGIQVSKKQSVSTPFIRKDSILWGASVTER